MEKRIPKTLKGIDFKKYRHNCVLQPVNDKETKQEIAAAMARVSKRLSAYKGMQNGVIDGAQSQYSQVMFK